MMFNEPDMWSNEVIVQWHKGDRRQHLIEWNSETKFSEFRRVRGRFVVKEIRVRNRYLKY